jgi:hypothetical protein
MPLAFDSLSHGQIAFGFFNIESDLLLLEHYFFFATDFCQYISEAATIEGGEAFSTEWTGFDIADRMAIGDLMGAIHGIRYTGFMGEVYRRFPFPAAPEAFKQNPEGILTQPVMKEILLQYGREATVVFSADASREIASVGEYRFARPNFQSLLRYVWQGGFPLWRNGAPPAYVIEMKHRIEVGLNPLFHDLHFYGNS